MGWVLILCGRTVISVTMCFVPWDTLKGKPAAEDVLVLDGLEKAPHFEALYRGSVIVPVAADRLNGTDLLKGAEGYTYLYRLNCGEMLIRIRMVRSGRRITAVILIRGRNRLFIRRIVYSY